MNKPNNNTEETVYLSRGKSMFGPAEFPENSGEIPVPFTGDGNSPQDQTMERLDEVLRSTGSEVIFEDSPDDGDADDPGQA
jgi:hypothetical protein